MNSRNKRISLKILTLVILGAIFIILSQQTTIKSAPEISSVAISPLSLADSAHKNLACVNCHFTPHINGVNTVEEINDHCATCHIEVCNQCNYDVHFCALDGRQGALCTDCHGIHDIKKTDDPNSKVYRLNISETCLQCHEDIAKSYHYSLHGTAVGLGSLKAATCADCHTNHQILPSSNPCSTVAKENIPETCAQCHKVPEPNFAKGIEHVTPQDKERAFSLWIVWKIFIGIILIGVIKDCTIAIFELIRRLKQKEDSIDKDDHDTWDV